MRRRDKEINSEEVVRILEAEHMDPVYHGRKRICIWCTRILCVFRPVYILPLCKEGSKLDNIKYNNRVSFCVVGQTETLPEDFSMKFESAILFGKASGVYGEEAQSPYGNTPQVFLTIHGQRPEVYG